ncbi:MAG: PAS domain-containing sensor histidine kinase [Phycisphaerae bacterium]|nr:PAS domain-containing sensor histidine kinase [Phycisphaerae bacterium]
MIFSDTKTLVSEGHSLSGKPHLVEALFENNPCQTIVVDSEGRIVTFNRAKRDSGDRMPAPGDLIFRDYAGGYEHDMYSELMECIRTTQTRRFPDQKYGGKILSTTISAFPGGATIITEDVTEQKKAEAELRQSEAFNRALFDYNPCQTIIVDKSGRIVTFNKAKRESGDRLPKEGDIIFKDYAGRYEHDMYSELMECIRKEQTRRFPDQKYADKILSTTISPFPGGATIITEDVTQRVEAERKLASANEVLKEKDRLKTAFVSTIAHELRTSLCIFQNAVSNMNSGAMGKVNGKLRETFEMAGESVRRLAHVIDDFVELSEVELGQGALAREQLDMTVVCREAIEAARPRLKDRNIHFKTLLPEGGCLVTADRSKMVRVLRHLFDNASKYAPEGGEVEFCLQDRGRDIAFYVKDNGPGIAEENLEKIFDCFTSIDVAGQSRRAGIGLGLTLVREIVKMHGGEVLAVSKPGKATTFRVVIPK